MKDKDKCLKCGLKATIHLVHPSRPIIHNDYCEKCFEMLKERWKSSKVVS